MLGRLAKAAVAAVFVAAVAPAVPAVAQDGTWTVSPGGAFHGEAGETVVSVQDGVRTECASSSVDGVAAGGSGLDNPLATFPSSPGLGFHDCSGPLGLTFAVQHVGTWRLVCDSYDGDVAYCRIVDVVFDYSGPGCAARINGYLDVTYTNSTGVWRILPNYTLTVSFVDPNANCLGLVAQGRHVAVDAEFAVTPNLTITSPAPVAALDDTWTIAPGGDFFGLSADAPVFAVAETGVNVVCSSAEVVGTTASGTGLTDPLAVLPDPGTTLADCQSIFRPYDIEQVGDWYLHGDSYDGVDVVTGRITGVELDVNGLGCAATIAGDLDVTYTNSTDRLTVLPNPTLEFTFVDPVNDCLGLFQQGEHLSLDVAFQVTPDLTITSP